MNITNLLPGSWKQFTLFAFLVISSYSFSQEKRTISGYISDDKTGERMIGATVYDTLHRLGAVANEYGFYSITVPNDHVVLKFSSYGLLPELVNVPMSMTTVNVSLKTAKDLDEVVISAKESQRSVESTNSGTIELQMDKIDKLPVLLGEKDVIKIVQLLPGVKSGGEGSSGIYVRGGGPDQNLILLDGVPVYNASHLFGFFSVFNSDALSQVTLIKGGFPARYGGRISSVLDMRMKEGNTKHYNVEGSVGLIASRILIEGPIKNGKTAFAISARRTYIDILSQPFQDKANRGGYFFYDVNAKLHHKINDKHHLYVSGYFGKDKAYFKSENNYDNGGGGHSESHSESQLKWGNAIAAVRWNWRISPKIFANTTLTYSQYQFRIGFSESDKNTDFNGNTQTSSYGFSYLSGINDWSGKMDFTYVPGPKNNIKFGVGDTYHTFKPGVNRFESNDQSGVADTSFGSYDQYAHELFTYIENDQIITSRLKINYGLHLSAFLVGGKEYVRLQPRFSGNYLLTENSSIKLAYARTAQYLHLLSNTGIGLPTDLWVPATQNIAPITADQFSLGYNHEFLKQYNAVVEVYYKKMNNLIQYKEGAGFLGNATDWQSKVEAGQGWAYGAEFFVEKRKGKFSGWAGYTLSWSERQFAGINGGEKFFYRYDRRHDISIVFTYDINEKWNCGVVFVYGTGNAVTLPTQYFNVAPNPVTNAFGGGTVGYFDKVNDYRMPAYHRMDVGFNRTKKVRWGETILSLSVYNVYNRKNPFYVYTEAGNNGTSKLKQVSLFPIIPSISWKFKIDFEALNKEKHG